MLHRRPRNASITPGEGRIGTSTPAMIATFSDHGPVAFTVRSARISASRPRDVVVAPRRRCTTPSCISRPVTSTWFSRSAPFGRAVAKKRSGIRIASIVASGTRTAAFRSGFSIGSSRSACSGVSCCVGMPDASQPVEEARQVCHVLVGDGDEQPVVLLERARRDATQESVLLDALHGGLVIVHRVARAAVQQTVVASRRPRRELAAFDQRDAQPAEREVVRESAAGAAAADDQDVRVM